LSVEVSYDCIMNTPNQCVSIYKSSIDNCPSLHVLNMQSISFFKNEDSESVQHSALFVCVAVCCHFGPTGTSHIVKQPPRQSLGNFKWTLQMAPAPDRLTGTVAKKTVGPVYCRGKDKAVRTPITKNKVVAYARQSSGSTFTAGKKRQLEVAKAGPLCVCAYCVSLVHALPWNCQTAFISA
jgi:hypothetical protein